MQIFHNGIINKFFPQGIISQNATVSISWDRIQRNFMANLIVDNFIHGERFKLHYGM